MSTLKINFDDSKTWEGMERDLSFHEVHNPAPKALTKAQVAQFNELGYITGLPVYGPREVEENRSYFDRALAKAEEEGMDSYAIRRMQIRSRNVWDIVTNPVILDYVEDLLGPNIVAWGTHYFCKLPGDGKRVSWHQDASYWPLTPAKTVTVWLAIDDSDIENGCMKVIPGTHRLGQLDFEMSGTEEGSVLPQKIVDAETLGTPHDMELKAGEISIHADMLVHGSEPNNSKRRRCGFTVRYAAADVRAGDGWNQNSVVARGSDPSGHWANHARPAVDVIDD